VLVASDVEDARYDYDQRQLNHIMGERMCRQAWANLVWLWEWGVALDGGEEFLLSARGIAGAQRSLLEEGGAAVEKEWAPVVSASLDRLPSSIARLDPAAARAYHHTPLAFGTHRRMVAAHCASEFTRV
jgi:hypothetical protein